MLLRDGHVVAEGWWHPYRRELPHSLFSLSKSFTSAAIGLAVSEGLLKTEDSVISYFPEHAKGEPDERLSSMTIRHLLTMSSGHGGETLISVNRDNHKSWSEIFFSAPLEYEPGSQFVYNSGATYMLSAILQKVAGMTMLDYLRPRLFDPLGIVNPFWETCPDGITAGGWGLYLRTEDIAKFGQLLLQEGIWNGTRLLDSGWIQEATSKQISNGDAEDSEWSQGYGYQFWRCRYGAYRADGAFGQLCVVMPEQRAIFAATAAVDDIQAVLSTLWKHILPAFSAASVPADPASEDSLKRRLEGLSIQPPGTLPASGRESEISGRRLILKPNSSGLEWLSLQFRDDEAELTVSYAGQHLSVLPGRRRWQDGETVFEGNPNIRVSSAFSWDGPDRIEAAVRVIESPVCITLALVFDKDNCTLHYKEHPTFENTGTTVIEGAWE
ncbi:serine hydrolase [Paenibacillus sp. HN-1]|nr:serine hydrolase [Paenibacillus sp. CGMCC 1.18879]MBY9087899.1 serine hydrolase [Paenibacillus sinensis]